MADWTREHFGTTAGGKDVEQWIAQTGGYTAKILLATLSSGDTM